MALDYWKIDNNKLENLKKAYKKLYEQSLNTMLSKQQQDVVLDKLIDDLFLERLSKLINEDTSISKEKSTSFYADLKELMAKWKKEFDSRNS